MTLDQDGDRKLSRAEFENIVTLPATGGRRAIDTKRLFNTLDLDHDQTVSFEEFFQYMSKQLPWIEAGISQQSYDSIVAQFTSLDENGDRKLSRSEFDNLAGLPGFLQMHASDIDNIFKLVDLDADGSVTLDEFMKYMSKRKDLLPFPAQVNPQKDCLRKNMERLGFELSSTDGGRKGVQGDGNCQFYSLAWELFNTTSKHVDVRSNVISYLRGPGNDEFSAFYAPVLPSQPDTFDAYLDLMAKDKTWGDQLTLQAAVNVFKIKAHVLTAEQFNASARPILTLTPQQSPNAIESIIWISFAAQHYSPIKPTARTPKDLLA